jgi:DNA-binding IclR family transcriptional regulator
LEHGASARILLGSMSPPARRAVLAPLAARDPERAAQLEEDVQLALRRGWATSREEIDRGVWAVSAPVHDADGHVVAALSVPSPLVRAPGRGQGPAAQAGAREGWRAHRAAAGRRAVTGTRYSPRAGTTVAGADCTMR